MDAKSQNKDKSKGLITETHNIKIKQRNNLNTKLHHKDKANIRPTNEH